MSCNNGTHTCSTANDKVDDNINIVCEIGLPTVTLCTTSTLCMIHLIIKVLHVVSSY